MTCLPGIDGARCEPTLEAAVRSALRSWDAQVITVHADHDIQHEGDKPKAVYLVESGWMYSYALRADGQRQILFLHQAGDIAGLAGLFAERASCSLRSLGNCVLHEIPTAAFESAALQRPEIALFFLRKSAQMQAILMRTLVAVGRMEARHRIVWLILMLHDRAGRSDSSPEIIDMPFNQSEIGDMLGLTNVSISKVLCQLSEEGYIERKGDRIVLLRRGDMQKMIGFDPIEFSADVQINARRRADAPHPGRVSLPASVAAARLGESYSR